MSGSDCQAVAEAGALGAMAFTVGEYGLHTLTSLGSLIGLMYSTSALFVVVCLGAVCAVFRLNILAAAPHQRRAADRPGHLV